MSPPVSPPRLEQPPDARRQPTATDDWPTQVRGSALLLVGRVLALGTALAVQILVVQSLSRADYGAFAYALAVVTVAEGIALLGLYRGTERFVPWFEEQGDRTAAGGVVVVVVAACLVAGAVVVGGTWAAAVTVGHRLVSDPLSLSLLQVLIPLAVLQALERILDSLFAVYARPRRIFVRRYLLAPGLRLAVVAALVVRDVGPMTLAAGYVTAAFVGLVVAGMMLATALRTQGLDLRGALSRRKKRPWGIVLRYCLPLFCSDLVWTLLLAVDTLLLGALRDTSAVAGLRAVYPVALLNQLVLASFTLLFTPAASRWFARGDTQSLADLHHRAGAWVAVVSFPLLAVTMVLADPVIDLLFGPRYADAAPALAVLALGLYAHASLGVNGLTLAVLGQVRAILLVDAGSLAFSVVANLVLIPRHGMLGAAVASALALSLHGIVKEVIVRRLLPPRPEAVAAVRITVACGAVLLAGVAWASPPPVVAGFLSVTVTVWVVRSAALRLDLLDCFPEIRRIAAWLDAGRKEGG